MRAVANSPKFAKKVGVPQSIGKEFEMKDMKKDKKYAMGGMSKSEMPSKMGKVKTAKPKMGSASKRADGVAMKGKTRGMEVKMAKRRHVPQGLQVMMPSRGMGAVRPSKMPKAKTIRRKDNPDEVTMYAEGGKVKSRVNEAGNYTKPSLRKRLFDQIKAGDKGGAPGQWSARKAQMLARQYKKAGGGYRG